MERVRKRVNYSADPTEGNFGAQGVPRGEKVVSTPKNMSPKIIFVRDLYYRCKLKQIVETARD